MANPTRGDSSIDLSVVSPLHNEEGSARALFEAVCAAFEPLERRFEVLLVNDGSTDGTGEILDELARDDPRLCPVHLDVNAGEAAALSAGFALARGRIILTLDGDLQNDPADLPRLLELLELRDYRAVSGYRRQRQEAFWLRVLPSRVANGLIALVTGVPSRDNGCGLKAYRAEVVRGLCLPDGFHRFMPAIFGVSAAEFGEVHVRDRRRASGHSHYGLSRFFAVLRDLLAFPYIVRGPLRSLYWMNRLFAISILLLLGTALWSIRHPEGLRLFLTAFWITGYTACVRWNLRRWLRAQQCPTYRIRLSHTSPAAAPGTASHALEVAA